MKRFFGIVLAVIFVVAGFCVSGFSQTQAVPDGKLAVIFSDLFLDQKTGIAKYAVIVESLNREFQPRKTELETLQKNAQTLQDEITKTAAVADLKSISLKQDQLEQMKKDLQRKAEDAQAAYDARRKAVFTPLQNGIGKALEAYAKAQNISLIIDGSQVSLAYAADAIDITRAFITDFNSKNPPAATASPR